MEIESSMKRLNDSELEEVNTATQQKRPKTVPEISERDTSSEKPFQVRMLIGIIVTFISDYYDLDHCNITVIHFLLFPENFKVSLLPMIVSIYFDFIQAGKLKLRSHILAKSNELRSLEALVSKIQDPRVEVRVEVVAKSGRPSLVFTKKEKAALTNGVPFDDVRLVVDANGNYHLFVFHFDLVRSGTIDLTSDQLRSAVREVIEDHPCPGVNKEIVDKQDYVSSELEEKTLPWRRFTATNCARVMKRASITSTGEEKFKEKCRACHKVEQKLLERIKVKESLTEEHVKSRQSVSSKLRLFLTRHLRFVLST